MRLCSTLAIGLIFWATVSLAEEASIVLLEEGSVSHEEGLSSWDRIYQVTSHPRCANCHVGADNIPMWSGPSFEKTQRHGMNIDAGISRIGAEALLCGTCHTNQTSELDHGAPGVAMPWRLAPVEAEWFEKSSDEICNQLRDPARNGNRGVKELAEHLGHDEILHWAWNLVAIANRHHFHYNNILKIS